MSIVIVVWGGSFFVTRPCRGRQGRMAGETNGAAVPSHALKKEVQLSIFAFLVRFLFFMLMEAICVVDCGAM